MKTRVRGPFGQAMKSLSQRATRMPRSGIRAVMDRAWSMRGVVRLMTGEPDFPTPPHVVAAVHEALDAGHTRYVPNAGLPELREAIARKYADEIGVPTAVSNTLVTNSGTLGVMTAFLSVLDPGDEVLLPDPGWPNYEMAVGLVGGRAVRYRATIEDAFVPDPRAIERLVGSQTKCLVICSPSNPTGQVYDRALLEELVAIARRHDLYIVSDEMYCDFVFEGEHASLADLAPERSVVITGVSKSYAMTGFRVGFLRAPEDVIEVAAKLQEPLVSCGTAISQHGALAAITGPQTCVHEMRDAYRRRRDLAVAFLEARNARSYTPRGAFYLMVDVASSGLDGEAFAMELLETRRIAVAPGPTFGPGSKQYVRISLASPENDILAGLKAIHDMLPATTKERSRIGSDLQPSQR